MDSTWTHMQPRFWGIFHTSGARSGAFGGAYTYEDANVKLADVRLDFPHCHYELRVVEGAEKVESLKDMKAALGTNVKPDITHIRTPLLNYGARNCEYGNDKYERANYIRPTQGGLAADFNRYRGYLRAAMSHLVRNLDAMERHQALDPNLTDEVGMRAACFAVDNDPSEKVGPSLLPNIGGTVASLNMALEQAVAAGLLPNDPGTPWKPKA